MPFPKHPWSKALLCNNAEPGIYNRTGFHVWFGMLNARKAVEAMEANYFISNTTPATQTITVPAGVRQLKVMLYWADPAAAPCADQAADQ